MWNYSTDPNNFVNDGNSTSFSYTPKALSGEDFSLFEADDSQGANVRPDWLVPTDTSIGDGFSTSDFANNNLDANWAQFLNVQPSTSSISELPSALTSPTFSDSQRSGYFDSPKEGTLHDNVLLYSTDEDEKTRNEKTRKARSSVSALSGGLEIAWGKGRGGSRSHKTGTSDKGFGAGASSGGASSSSTTARPSREASRRPNLMSENAQAPSEPKRRRRRRGSGDTPTNRRRDTHNAIERQYRDRLNNHFTDLLSILPDDVVHASIGSDAATIETKVDGSKSFNTKKVCKGAVLELAMKHIQKLETENEELSNRNLCIEKKLKALGGKGMGWGS